MAACRKLLLPSMVSVLFCFSLLSANLEERSTQGPLGEGTCVCVCIARAGHSLAALRECNTVSLCWSLYLPESQRFTLKKEALVFFLNFRGNAPRS